MEPLTQSVVVGVTGAGENSDALRFVIDEARRLGCGVTLVHTVRPSPPPSQPAGILLTDDSWLRTGGSIVAQVRQEMEELLDGEALDIATVVRRGSPGFVFGELSTSARMIVLQHRDLSRLHRVFTGSTVASVATQSHCPVVAVPATQRHRKPVGHITAGVHGDGGPRQVLETAFAEAAARGCSLRLLHAWRLATEYDDILADDPRWAAGLEAGINAAIEDLRAKFPEVTVHLEVRHEFTADALVEAASGSDLPVIGRHSGLPVLPTRVGALARAMVAHAPCPTLIVPV